MYTFEVLRVQNLSHSVCGLGLAGVETPWPSINSSSVRLDLFKSMLFMLSFERLLTRSIFRRGPRVRESGSLPAGVRFFSGLKL